MVTAFVPVPTFSWYSSVLVVIVTTHTNTTKVLLLTRTQNVIGSGCSGGSGMLTAHSGRERESEGGTHHVVL